MNMYEIYNYVLDQLRNTELNGRDVSSLLANFGEVRDRQKCEAFILQFLRVYEKNKIKIADNIKDLSDMRLQHTASCFLLGTFFYLRCDEIKRRINSLLSSIKIEEENVPEKLDEADKMERFYFIWMLTCLFHDLGYSYENGDVDVERNVEFELNKVVNDVNEKYLPPKFNEEKIIRKYYEYRKCRFYCVDHGIYGGAKLYQNLTKAYPQSPFKEFYNLAADTIMCHNIFYCEEGDSYVDCYKKHKMDLLIRESGNKKREYKEQPLLFLLSLVDSIDPVKKFQNTDVLKCLCLSYNCDSDIVIDISCNAKVDNTKFDQYIKSLRQMDDWLTDVKVENDKSENAVLITISVANHDKI